MRILTLLFLLIATTTFAQNGTIKGVIRTSDKLPAEFTLVSLKGYGKGANTNKNGEYHIKNVVPGTYTVLVATEERTAVVKAGETTELDITLSGDAKMLQEVEIATEANKYIQKDPSPSLRVTTPLIEVPQNIQVITSQALRDQQVISMSDNLVRNVSGLVRMEHWGDMYTNITARGSQIQAFRNGFNVVNSYWGPLTEDMSFVENIEVVKGPAGFMLSSGDPSGLYNVVTKKPTGETKGEATFTVGSFDLYRGTLDLDGRLSKNGRLLYRLNLAAQNKKSHRANEYNDRYVVAPVISYQLDDRTKLTLEYNYQRANMSNVGSFYVFSPDDFAIYPVEFTSLPAGTEGTRINDHSVYLNIQHELGQDWKITGQVSRFMYNQRGSSMWPTTVNPDGTMIRNVGIWDAQSHMSMAQVFVNGEVRTGPVRHRILGGLDMANKSYLADWGQSHDLDTVGAEFNPYEPDLGIPVNGYPDFDRETPLAQRAQAAGGLQDQRYTALYVQDELGFFNDKARLTLAGRYTSLSQFYYIPVPDKASHFTPRVGLSVSPDKGLAIYALYDQAFIPQTGIMANGGKVQPVTGNNMEVGVKKEWMDGKWNTSLSVYRILKNNELTADPNSAPTSGLSVEMGQKLSQGIEFDLRGNIARGLSLTANYAYTDSRIQKVTEGVTAFKVGDVVPGFARHTANAWLQYKLMNGALSGLGISAGASFLGDRQTYWDPSPDPTKTIDDYLRVDGGLFWEGSRMRVAVNVFNALNAYLYSGSYYSWNSSYYWQTEAPRNLRVSLAYRFQ